jgi:predicted transcriptional regulator
VRATRAVARGILGVRDLDHTMYALYIMQRTQIYLDEAQSRALARRADAAGRTRSALIREAIDDYLARPDDDDAGLRRLREAVAEASGVAPYLEPGAEYVEAQRGGGQRQRELERRWRG